MNSQVRRYLASLIVGLVVTVAIIGIASKVDSFVGVLLWPGMMAAAAAFPEGINSDWPSTYLVLASLINVFVFSWIVFGVTAVVGHFQRRRG